MADISRKELAALIRDVVAEGGRMEFERVNEMGPGGQAAACCGCVCISKCFWNSSAGLREMLIRVERGELQIEMPTNLMHLLAAEMRE